MSYKIFCFFGDLWKYFGTLWNSTSRFLSPIVITNCGFFLNQFGFLFIPSDFAKICQIWNFSAGRTVILPLHRDHPANRMIWGIHENKVAFLKIKSHFLIKVFLKRLFNPQAVGIWNFKKCNLNISKMACF